MNLPLRSKGLGVLAVLLAVCLVGGVFCTQVALAVTTSVIITSPTGLNPTYEKDENSFGAEIAYEANGTASITVEVLDGADVVGSGTATGDPGSGMTKTVIVNLGTGIGNGPKDLKVTLVDNMGTPDTPGDDVSRNQTKTGAVIIDNTPATVAVDTPAAAQYLKPGDTLSNIGFTYTEDYSYSYTLQVKNATATASSKTVSTGVGSGQNVQVTGQTLVINAGAADGVYNLVAKVQDKAGNVGESTATDRVVVDNQAPTGSISINAGDTYTNNAAVTATISATDNHSAAAGIEMEVSQNSDFSGAAWEAYATSANINLNAGDGTKPVYIRFRDQAGNVSGSFSDDIILDTASPTAAIASISAPQGQTEIKNFDNITIAGSMSDALTDVSLVSIDVVQTGPTANNTTNLTYPNQLPGISVVGGAITGTVPFDVAVGDADTVKLVLRVQDAAGNTAASAASNGLTINNDPPDTVGGTWTVTKPGTQTEVKKDDQIAVSFDVDNTDLYTAAVNATNIGGVASVAMGANVAKNTFSATLTIGDVTADGLKFMPVTITRISNGKSVTKDTLPDCLSVTVNNTAPVITAVEAIKAGVGGSTFLKNADSLQVTVTVDNSALYTGKVDQNANIGMGAAADLAVLDATHLQATINNITVAPDATCTVTVTLTRTSNAKTGLLASNEFKVDNLAPVIAATIAGPAQQTALKNNDAVTISGTVTDAISNESIATAVLHQYQADGVTEIGAGTDIKASLTLDPDTNALSGSVNVGALDANARSIKVTLTAQDQSGNVSGAFTTSALVVDNLVPTATINSVDYPGTQSAIKDGDPITIDAAISGTGTNVGLTSIVVKQYAGGVLIPGATQTYTPAQLPDIVLSAAGENRTITGTIPFGTADATATTARITINVYDEANNTAASAESAALDINNLGPGVVTWASADPQGAQTEVKDGDTVTVSITLDGDHTVYTVAVDGSGIGAGNSVAMGNGGVGNTYTKDLTVSKLDNQVDVILPVTITRISNGKSSTDNSATVDVNNDAPIINSVTVTSGGNNYAKDGDNLLITANTDGAALYTGNVLANANIGLGGDFALDNALTATIPGNIADGTEGDFSVQVQLTRKSNGKVGAAVTSDTIWIDGKVPVINPITISLPGIQSYVKDGNVIPFTATLSEANCTLTSANLVQNDIATTTTAIAGLTISGTTLSGDITLPALQNDTTQIMVKVQVTDSVGNNSLATNSNLLDVDIWPVAADRGMTLKAPVGQTAVSNGNTITLSQAAGELVTISDNRPLTAITVSEVRLFQYKADKTVTAANSNTTVASTITVDTGSGALTGGVTLGTLEADCAYVKLAVYITDGAGNVSVVLTPGDGLAVDNTPLTPPTAVTLKRTDNGLVVKNTDIMTVTVEGVGAAGYTVTADATEFGVALPVDLTLDGNNNYVGTFTVNKADEAATPKVVVTVHKNNTGVDATADSNTVTLDNKVPVVVAAVNAPNGQTTVANGQTVTFGTSVTEVNTPVISSAKIIQYDAFPADLGADIALNVGTDIVLTNGVISGSKKVDAFNASTKYINLQVTITDAAGNQTIQVSGVAVTVDNSALSFTADPAANRLTDVANTRGTTVTATSSKLANWTVNVYYGAVGSTDARNATQTYNNVNTINYNWAPTDARGSYWTGTYYVVVSARDTSGNVITNQSTPIELAVYNFPLKVADGVALTNWAGAAIQASSVHSGIQYGVSATVQNLDAASKTPVTIVQVRPNSQGSSAINLGSAKTTIGAGNSADMGAYFTLPTSGNGQNCLVEVFCWDGWQTMGALSANKQTTVTFGTI